MVNNKKRSYAKRLRLRIGILWATVIFMLLYMIAIGELGLGDSRMMTPLAQMVSRILFFGGLAAMITRICLDRRLLKNRMLLLEQQREAEDERKQFLHDKSGGLPMDILLLVLLAVTCTAALCNMTAFALSLSLLAVASLLKIGCYCYYNHKS